MWRDASAKWIRCRWVARVDILFKKVEDATAPSWNAMKSNTVEAEGESTYRRRSNSFHSTKQT